MMIRSLRYVLMMLGAFATAPAIFADDAADDSASYTTQSGLKIIDQTVGTGDVAESGQIVTVHYVGTLEDGQMFDSSRSRGQPFSFRLGAGHVIAGWEEGVKGMKVGGTRKLVIPSHLGYGKRGVGPIPGDATLVFEVELLKVS